MLPEAHHIIGADRAEVFEAACLVEEKSLGGLTISQARLSCRDGKPLSIARQKVPQHMVSLFNGAGPSQP